MNDESVHSDHLWQPSYFCRCGRAVSGSDVGVVVEMTHRWQRPALTTCAASAVTVGGKSDRTKLKNDENLEVKCTKMRPVAEQATIRMMVPRMEFM